jgi:hypothetical protein
MTCQLTRMAVKLHVMFPLGQNTLPAQCHGSPCPATTTQSHGKHERVEVCLQSSSSGALGVHQWTHVACLQQQPFSSLGHADAACTRLCSSAQ